MIIKKKIYCLSVLLTVGLAAQGPAFAQESSEENRDEGVITDIEVVEEYSEEEAATENQQNRSYGLNGAGLVFEGEHSHTDTDYGLGSTGTEESRLGGGIGFEHRDLTISDMEEGPAQGLSTIRSTDVDIRATFGHDTSGLDDETLEEYRAYGEASGFPVDESQYRQEGESLELDARLRGEYGITSATPGACGAYGTGSGTGELNIDSRDEPVTIYGDSDAIIVRGEVEGGLHCHIAAVGDLMLGATGGLRIGDAGDMDDVVPGAGLHARLTGERFNAEVTGRHEVANDADTTTVELGGDVLVHENLALGADFHVSNRRISPSFGGGYGAGLTSGGSEIETTSFGGGVRASWAF